MRNYVKNSVNIKEEYIYRNIKPNRDEPYTCIHIITDPLYKYYGMEIEYNEKKKNEIKVLGKIRKMILKQEGKSCAIELM